MKGVEQNRKSALCPNMEVEQRLPKTLYKLGRSSFMFVRQISVAHKSGATQTPL